LKPGTILVYTLAVLVVLAAVLCVTATPAEPEVASASTVGGLKLPIIMYHSIVKDANRWGTYVISPDEFESDLKYFEKNGYTSVTVQDLIDAVYEAKPLPEKPVMITLDDGYYNNYLYALPLLRKYNDRAVVSIVGKFTDQYSVTEDNNPVYSHVTWGQVNEMIDSGFIEIQNHSYNLHKIDSERVGSMKVSGESVAHYAAILSSDVIRLQSLIDSNTKHLPTAFTYPYGLVSKDSNEILKDMGFKATLTCYPGINTITGDPNCLYMLKRLIRPHGKSAQAILEARS
jgi:peptidoglycan/xylan/chitin deacetylase (PgdA/CDA1 family)